MDHPSSEAGTIMMEFARSTGLEPETAEPRRYLWTDAFAVCNFLELHRLTGEATWRNLALHLVDQVHHTLGRHRADDERRGWISSLSEAEGKLHPTRGGLRIGKPLQERGAREHPDNQEWDRDGQYYHYLTKWMHALHRVSRVTGDQHYSLWARELARTAHEHFSYTHSLGGVKRLYWKMSIDLSRPQVPSMGQHDALDGLVTCSELLQDGSEADDSLSSSLKGAVEDLKRMCRGRQWETDDSLGIGGLLFDAARIAQLAAAGRETSLAGAELLEEVVASAVGGLELFTDGPTLQMPAAYRLAFRELGLSIGLHAAALLRQLVQGRPGLFGANVRLSRQLDALEEYLPMGEKIESFWLDDSNRRARSWNEHREINMVMLATSLAPQSFIEV